MKRFMSTPLASLIRLSRFIVLLSTRMRLFSVPSIRNSPMDWKNAFALSPSGDGFGGFLGFFSMGGSGSLFFAVARLLSVSPVRSFSRSWSASDFISFMLLLSSVCCGVAVSWVCVCWAGGGVYGGAFGGPCCVTVGGVVGCAGAHSDRRHRRVPRAVIKAEHVLVSPKMKSPT